MTERDSSSRDRGDWGADPELRTLLRTMDQAHSLPPLSHDQVAGLVAATLEADAQLRPAIRPGARRLPVPALVAAASVLIAGALAWSTLTSGPGTVPSADAPVATSSSTSSAPPTPAPSAEASTAPAPSEPAAPSRAQQSSAPTTLVVESVPNLKCAVPNVEMLGVQQVAFAGTVSAVDGSLVTLTTTEVFRGDVTDTVEVQAPPADLAKLLSAVTFEVGKTYLVSATDGQVTLCGFSAEDTPDLRSLYQQAFAG